MYIFILIALKRRYPHGWRREHALTRCRTALRRRWDETRRSRRGRSRHGTVQGRKFDRRRPDPSRGRCHSREGLKPSRRIGRVHIQRGVLGKPIGGTGTHGVLIGRGKDTLSAGFPVRTDGRVELCPCRSRFTDIVKTVGEQGKHRLACGRRRLTCHFFRREIENVGATTRL